MRAYDLACGMKETDNLPTLEELAKEGSDARDRMMALNLAFGGDAMRPTHWAR